MPTVQEAAITNLQAGVRTEWGVYRYDADPELFDPAAITTGWEPGAAGWTYVATVGGQAGAEFSHDGTGGTIAFGVYDFRKDAWPDDIPVALSARYWDGAAWSPWAAVAWGYTTGAGKVRRSPEALLGEVKASIVGRWGKLAVPGITFGRLNIAQGAAAGAHSTALINPNELVPAEYAYQVNCDPPNAVDGVIDTVAAAEVLAGPEVLDYGGTDLPRLASFFGPHDPGVAIGGVPRFIQLDCTRSLTGWGVSWAAIPEMYNADAGEGQTALRDDSKYTTTVQSDSEGGNAFQVANKLNADPKATTWVQWIVKSNRTNVPMRVRLDFRAAPASSAALGKVLDVGISDARPVGQTTQNIGVTLGADWQSFIVDFDSSTDYGGAKISIKTQPGDHVAGGWTYQIRRLRVLVGWDHDGWAKLNDYKALYLGMDDGAGHEKWQRISWDLAAGGNFNIPPERVLVIADDAAVLKQQFDPGAATVLQMKNAWKWWHFEPGIGRMKLVLQNNPPNLSDIDTLAAGAIVLDDINFATNGLTWTATQAMVRKSPWGTGAFVADDYPSVGFGENYGTGYWVFDLGAFVAPTLALDAAPGAAVLYVSDTRPFQMPGTVRIGAEDLPYYGKDEGTLLLSGTVGTFHGAGALVTPLHDGAVGPGSSPQVAKTFDYVEVRRREGVPTIRDGVLLYSKLTAPGDPSAGGSKWERHPDWLLLRRFRDNTAAVVSAYAPPKPMNNGVYTWAEQARHICLAIAEMQPSATGVTQHPMMNELTVREWVPEAGGGGGYSAAAAGDVTAAIGYLLTRFGELAVTKYVPRLPVVPLGSLTVTPTTLMQAVTTLTGGQLARLWVDGLGYAYLDPGPNSLGFDAQDATWVWTEQNCWGATPEGDWSEAHQCAQVVIYAREPGTLRHHVVKYPEVRLQFGNVVEVKDAVVASREQAADLARATFRDANARRGLTVQCGAAPFVRPFQRHIVNLPSLDPSGEWTGINFYVAAYTHKFTVTNGVPTVRTAITLREMAL